MSDGIVTTTLGELYEHELEITTVEQQSDPMMWTVARECRYVGTNPELSAHVGEIVRRDVWVTIKCGHSVTGQQGV
jgi:hypothetical protein